MGIEGNGNNFNYNINNANKFVKNDDNKTIRNGNEEYSPLFPVSDEEPDCYAVYGIQIPKEPEEKDPDCYAVYAVQIPEDPEEKEPDCHAVYAVQIPNEPSQIDLPDLPTGITGIEPSVSAVYAIQIPDEPGAKIEIPKLPKPEDLPTIESGRENPINKFMEMIKEIIEKLLDRE